MQEIVAREALEAKRPKLIDLYLDGTIDKAMLDVKLAELDAELARSAAARHLPSRHRPWQRPV